MRGIYQRSGDFVHGQAMILFFPIYLLIFIIKFFFSPSPKKIHQDDILKETKKAYQILLEDGNFFWFPKSLTKIEDELLHFNIPKNFEITVKNENGDKNIYDKTSFEKKYLGV